MRQIRSQSESNHFGVLSFQAKIHLSLALLVGVALAVNARVADAATGDRPHIILIMADDLGYGDVSPLNSDSKIPTPTFERLAKEGMTFTDAHTPSAVCTPTRYGLLTGRYCWRSRLKRGVLNGYGTQLIESNRPTIASTLRDAGYTTAIVGKWHLGLGLHGGEDDLDLAKPLSYHPGHAGFEHSFVIPASLDFPPYVYFRDGNATETRTTSHAKTGFPAYTRRGPIAADFDMRACLDRLTDEAVEVINTKTSLESPLFLYFPLTAPHKPVLPNEKFSGSTDLGPYGDFVRQVDDSIGRVITALDEAKALDDTLLIVTSDNGSFMRRVGETAKDHTDDETLQEYRRGSHAANGPWRGTKADIWEAGHRVPFFVRLPGAKHAGTKVSQVVGLVDILATATDYVGAKRGEEAGPDSVSFAELLKDPQAEFRREPLICHSAAGMFAIRDGKWKLIAGNGSGGREQPKGKPFEEPWMLVDLSSDPEEQSDTRAANPDVFARLKAELMKRIGDDL